MSTLLTLGLANAVCAALLALVALIAGRFCRRPAVLHSLWLLVLLKLVTPPFWPVTVAHLPEEPAAAAETTATPPPSGLVFSFPDSAWERAASKVEPRLLPPHEREAEPRLPPPVKTRGKASPTARSQAEPGNEEKAAPPVEVQYAFVQPGPAPSAPATAPSTPAEQPQGLTSCVPLLGLAWLAGVVVWLIWAGRNVARFHRLLRHARRAGLEIQQQSDDLAARMGLSRGPEIWLLPGALPPLVWAALGRVRIFFPAKLLARLDDTERASLFAHELAHVRRRDHWVRWLELIASALYWWYPLVWLARRRLHVHEEECCDAWVIGEVPARTYAAAILNTLDFLAEDQTPLPVMASGLAGVELLKRRLNLIMDRNVPKRLSLPTRFIVVLVGLLLLSLRPNLAQTPSKPPPAKETSEQQADVSAPAQHQAEEDPEGFLPNPSPLQGRILTVGSVAFSPDGKRLAMGAGWVDQPFGELRLWDVDKGHVIATIRAAKGLRSVAFSPDGKYLASGELDGTIRLRDPMSGEVRASLDGHAIGVNSIVFSPDSKSLAAAGLDNVVTVWDVAARKRRLRLEGHTGPVTCVAFSPDGKTLASSSHDHNAILWDLNTGKARTTLKSHAKEVEFVTFSPDGQIVATASWDGTVKLWDATTGRVRHSLLGPGPMALCVAYSPDGKTLAISGPAPEAKVQLWDTATMNLLDVLENNTEGIWSVTFSPDGKQLATGSRDGTVKLWDVAGRKELTTVARTKERLFQPQPVLALAYSPHSKLAAVAGEDGSVQLCELVTGIQRFVLKGHADVVTCLAFSPDGKRLATGSPDRKIKLWDTEAGKEIRTLTGHANWIYALAFAPDGKTLASGSYDKTIRLWDSVTGVERRVLKGHKASIRALVFSPDGKMLASGGSDRTIRLWPMNGDGEPIVLKGHEETVRVLVFSPDGKTLASGSEDRTIKLWDVAKKSERATLKGHSAEVTALVFSQRGKVLLSGAAGGGVMVWDAAKGTQLSQLPNHNGAITGLQFAGSSQLLSASLDGTVKIWQAAPSPVRLLRGHTGPVVRLVISRDGHRLLSGSGWPQGDKTARLWDFQTGKELHVLRAQTPTDKEPTQIHAVALSPDGKCAVAGGSNGMVFFWDVETGKELWHFQGHDGEINALDFSPDGRHLLSGGRDKIIRLWEVKSGREVRKFEGHTDWVRNVRFSRDSKRFLSGGRDGVMRLWEVESSKQLREFHATEGWIDSVAWMPNQRQAICAAGGSVIQLWDVESGKLVRSFAGHAGGVTCVDVSPEGRRILSCGYDGTVRCWDAATGQQQKLFRQPGFVRAVKFSIDGRYAISGGGGRNDNGKYVAGGNDFPIRVWSLRDEQAARVMKPQLPPEPSRER